MDNYNKVELHDVIVTLDKGDPYSEEPCPEVKSRPLEFSPLSECPMEEIESKVREFLSKRERINFYRLEDPYKRYFKSFTDDDVELIKEKFEHRPFPECYSDDLDDNPRKIVEGEDWYSSAIYGAPTDPIWQLTEVGELYLTDWVLVNLGRIVHYYGMSISFFDLKDGKIKGTDRFAVQLTDEDYIFIVSRIIAFNHEYYYTDLALDNNELGIKIYNAWYTHNKYFSNDMREGHLPFLIRFDELEEDAYKIAPLDPNYTRMEVINISLEDLPDEPEV